MAQSNEELHAALRECFKADPNYAEILNLTGDMGIHDIKSRVIAVFEAYRKQHELEAEIRALEFAWDSTDLMVKERIAELKAEREGL